ncbi:hypothetical protein [Belliella pelovolcani]|uniref:hypothetical protein n=1 Tax=Belliella pelovolcani TaxID=529505 RepID=UPI00391D651A
MSNLFKNKSVILIGPAEYAYSNAIDTENFDIVVRINHSVPVRGITLTKTGSRCDVYYPNPDLINSPICFSEKIKHIRTDKSHLEFWHSNLEEKVTSYNFDFYQYCKRIGSNINTGMAAILDIFFGEPSLFYVTGISFYRGEKIYHQNYSSKFQERIMLATRGNISSHNQFLQWKYFSENILPYIEADDFIKSIREKDFF